MQNKRDQRVAVAAKWVAPTLANIQVWVLNTIKYYLK
jgi:hypothetical protein